MTAKILADLGARVIKVEEPAWGDPVRLAPPLDRERSGLAALLLAGVESVALDLKQPAGREVAERLIERADVLLESFRPGTLERFGLAPDELRRRHPRLVVCSLSGWGANGPWAARAGHDLTYQAVAGLLAPTGTMPAFPAADLLGAWSAATAILAALVRRGTSGDGATIDASLYDAALHGNLVSWADESAGISRGVGQPHDLAGALPCYDLYRTADGRLLAVAPLEEHFWRRFCAAAGREDLVESQYRADGGAGVQVATLIAGRTLAEWQALLDGVDVPVAPVLTAAEAANHPQAAARGLLIRGDDGFLRLAFPARIDGERPAAGGRFPRLGADTAAILDEVAGEVAAMSRWAQKKAGIGRRAGWRRWLARRKVARRD